MDELSFFSHEKISEQLYIVTEGYSMVHRFTIGVVVGQRMVLVIDSGMGLGGNIREYIESFVGKGRPMICVCTHCHSDHVGGAALFDKAYCSRKDWEDKKTYAYTFSYEQRLADAAAFALGNTEVIEYISRKGKKDIECKFHDVADGDVFDLGGIKIEAIAVPGHTPGSVIYVNRAEGYAFTGDSVNTDVHLEGLDRSGLVRYRDAVKRFISLAGKNVTLYPSHLPLAMNISVAENLISACDELLEGNNDRDPPAERIFPDRQNQKHLRIHYFYNAGIAYDAKKLGLSYTCIS